MRNIYDRWHKSRPASGEQLCADHQKTPTAEHGKGKRWQVRWRDGDRQHCENFVRRDDADRFAARLGHVWCIVPKCGNSAATEPPVLLCTDHCDLLLKTLGRKKPLVHDPLVYFIRNGARIKIGWTTNLKGRLSALSLPADAAVLTVPGGPQTEKEMHALFANLRVGRTEWFEITPELEAFIASRNG